MNTGAYLNQIIKSETRYSSIRVKEARLIAATLFRLIHRHVSPLQNVFLANFVIDEVKY
jgi:hypothetical protein